MFVCVFAGCYNYLYRMQALDAIRDAGKSSCIKHSDSSLKSKIFTFLSINGGPLQL